MEKKANVLILGGCGFIGRNLVAYLLTRDWVGYIRVVDKVPPQLSWLNDEHKRAFSSEIVEFKSANLINPESCANAFYPPDDEGGHLWDVVVNCAGETKPDRTEPVYREGVLALGLNCAREAARLGAARYVEVSAGEMASSSDKRKRAESADGAEPWTLVAKYKLQLEKELRNVSGLNYTILRPALVYGPGDKAGLTTRLVTASVYKHLGETLKLLWNAELALNTVHVSDLCRAIEFVCRRDDTVGEVYNVVDDASSTQGSLARLSAEIFGIHVDFYGALASRAVDVNAAAEDANDKHLHAWAAMCARAGVENTPLSPLVSAEMLANKHLNLDGRKLRDAGFEYLVPRPTAENVRAVLEGFAAAGLFPRGLF